MFHVEQIEKVNIKKCPVCGSDKQKPFLVCRDYTVSQQDFELVECGDCGFRYTQNPPEENQAYTYYESEDYVSHSSSRKGLINFMYNIVRRITLQQKVRVVKAQLSGNRLLDIGAGTGHFLNEARKQGLQVQGLEPSTFAVNYAKENFDLALASPDELHTLPNASFDAVTLWHVLEHVYSLNDYLRQIHRVLDEKGMVFIAVPNCASKDAQLYKEHWAAYDVPRHLYHFRPGDMHKLMQEHDFQVIKSIPMKFDAYYVSLLSEKYRGGSLFRALWNGFLSNRSARRSGMYSSLIYVAQKRK